MRILGWCTECRKVKQVRVSANDLALATRGGVVSGICAQCEEQGRQR